jgi:hypothetical protein
MKHLSKIFIAIFFLTVITSCTKTDKIDSELEIQNFVWKGLNAFYLWQGDISDLQDNSFSTQKELDGYLSNKTPENLFESLLFERGTTDKWSWIVDDYIALEQLFAGVRKTNGMKFGLVELYPDSPEIFGYVRYVLPNSEAANLGVQRGDVIYGIDGTQLTRNNYQNLLSSDSYTVNFGNLQQSGSSLTISANNINITLNKEVLNENPIHIVTTYESNGHKIGYIFYNQFVSNYDTQLNEAFLQLKNENITDLVLDLRYNGGGSVQTAVYLASMITGQFPNELFAKEMWNSKWQSYLEAEHPDYLINNFTNTIAGTENINSLNLNEVTIIITENSASASELVINGLLPYINVNLVGTTSHGKYVGSVTLYDSDSYTRDDNTLNENHHYAMQPIVLEMVNKLGENNKNGFTPENYLAENYTNLGQLGNPNEPLFHLAINKILGLRTNTPINNAFNLKMISNSNLNNPFYENMFVELR